MEETKSKRPLDTPFRQQTLKAWRPILTPKAVIITFSIVGIIFIPIGVLIISESDSVIEVSNNDGNYADLCRLPDGTDANPCTINITVAETMKPPVYMYYKLSDFYQNHRRYVKSRMDAQLRGVPDQTPSLLQADCEPFHEYNESLADPDVLSNAISPCGLISRSVFNDTFSLLKDGAAVPDVTEHGIAWPSDVSDKFHNSEDGSTGNNFPPFAYEKQASCADFVNPDGSAADSALIETCESYQNLDSGESAGWCFFGSGYCVENEHFMVWMRTAGLPTFRKLYAIINSELAPGDYQIVISNGKWSEADGVYMNYDTGLAQTALFPVDGFGGSKQVVLSTVSWMGGKNPFLGYAYVVVGAICLALALLFLIKDRLSPRRLGDPSYITFHKKEADK